MAHSILITGVSGYLGGTLLANLQRDTLPPHNDVYALVRSKEQEDAVQTYGVLPIHLNLDDESAIIKAIAEAKITIIFYLIDAVKHDRQLRLIKALAEVKKQTGLDVHFLHTTGAKIFSGHAGLPTDRAISDADSDLFNLQKSSKAPELDVMNVARDTNNTIIAAAESQSVRSYIFIPCIVYGKGEGFGNQISIQTVAIVKAAKALRQVYDVNPEGAEWPVCHVLDNTSLFRDILQKILSGNDIGHGQNGYYLASSGTVAWRDLYTAMARALTKRGVVDGEAIKPADDTILAKMGEALGCPKGMVRLQLGGSCTLRAEHGVDIGWKARYPPQHILEAAEVEVDLILANLKD